MRLLELYQGSLNYGYKTHLSSFNRRSRENAQFVPFVGLIKQFEAKISQFFVIIDIVIPLKNSLRRVEVEIWQFFLWTTTEPSTLPLCACTQGNNAIYYQKKCTYASYGYISERSEVLYSRRCYRMARFACRVSLVPRLRGRGKAAWYKLHAHALKVS